jgi:protein TonB
MSSLKHRERRLETGVRTAILLLFALAAAGFCEDGAKKLTRAEALSAAVSKVEPEYPPFARQLKISGEVDLEAVVAEDGSVEKVNVVSGNPVLTKAGAEALVKWKFKPVVADGKPVKALAPVSFSFK